MGQFLTRGCIAARVAAWEAVTAWADRRPEVVEGHIADHVAGQFGVIDTQRDSVTC